MSKFKNAIFVSVLIFVSQFNGLYFKSSSKLSLSTKKAESQKTHSKVNKTFVSSNIAKKLGLKTLRGFGFTGGCTSSIGSLISSNLPSNAQKIYSEIVFPLQSAIVNMPQICLGDFTGETISEKVEFENAECRNIPLNSESTYGVVSLAAFNVPCNDLVTVSACMIFDQEGTAAIAFNGDLMGCAISLTGVGKIFQPFLKFIGAMGFGVSINKKFEKDFDVCYNSNGSVACGQRTAKAHFLFVLNLALPNFKVGSKDLKEYLELNATITYMIDLGNVTSTISSLVSSLFNSSSTCETKSGLIRTIRNLGAEYTMTIDGKLTLQLAKHTNGFLPNLDFELFSTVLVVTTGSGSTGLGAGIYLHLKSNLVEAIYKVFKSFMDRFLDLFGVSMPSINLGSLDSSMGLFIDTTMFGMKIGFPGISLECYFKFDGAKGSCKFNQNIFTALLEAAKWVIKKATKLFEETGATIAEFGSNTVDFAKDASKAVANWSTSKAKLVAREATKIANTVANAGESAAKEVLSAMVNMNEAIDEIRYMTAKYIDKAISGVVGFANSAVSDIKDVAGEAANFAVSVAGKALNVATNVGNAISSGVSTAGNEIKKFFKSWAKKKKMCKKVKVKM